MKREDAIKKIEEIKNLSKESTGVAYLSAATSWLLKDRIDQLSEQVTLEQKVVDPVDDWKTRVEKAERLLKDIGDALGIGEYARTPDTILFNVKNAVRRSRCLSLIEEHHTILVKDDDGDDMPEQLLSWGEDPEKYIETYRSVVAPLASNWLEICAEELLRGNLTSHPQKFEFAKERGMKDLDEVHTWMLKTRQNFVEMIEKALQANAQTPVSGCSGQAEIAKPRF